MTQDSARSRVSTTGPLLLASAYLVFGVALLFAVLGVGVGADAALALDIPLFLAGGALATRSFHAAHLRRRGAHGAAGATAAVTGVLGALLALLALLAGGGDAGAGLSIALQLFPATSALFGTLAALALTSGSYPRPRLRARLAAALLVLGALLAGTFTVLTFSLEAAPPLVYASAFGAPLALALGLATVALAWRRER